MTRIAYIHKDFRPASMRVISTANRIIEEYARDGLDLTLRQLYYQFVARDLIPNKDSEYKRIGSILNDGRLAGLIDWTAITDRTRYLRNYSHWATVADHLDDAAKAHARDMWDAQEFYVEVWIEKDALIGVLDAVCPKYQVPYFSCRGYPSQSEIWRAGQRIGDIASKGRRPVIIHLGDHDPSGIDMTRDVQERVSLFAGVDVEVRRIALNMDQIDEYGPPPNPAKLTDSRAEGYIERFGYSSWELDALDPKTLISLISTEIDSCTDVDQWNEDIAELKRQREQIEDLASRLEDEEE